MAQSKLTSFFSSARKRGIDDESDDETPGPSTEKKNSRPRGFAENWLKKYDWLFVENGGMKCDPCIKTKQNNPFTTENGCMNFRNSTLVRHQSTSSHVDALEKLKLRKDMTVRLKNVEIQQMKQSDEKTKRHITQLRTVYCMAKNGISARNFMPLMKLQQDNGCEYADPYYNKPEIVSEMETVLSDQIEVTFTKH